MKVVITISDSENAAAVARVRRMLAAAERNDVVYNGCEFVIERGDFTTIEDTRGLRDPEVLFAAIRNALAGEDGSDDQYVALPHGGVERSAPTSGARRQARQRAKGRAITVVLPPAAAAALDELRVRHDYTQVQAISAALPLLLELRDATPRTP